MPRYATPSGRSASDSPCRPSSDLIFAFQDPEPFVDRGADGCCKVQAASLGLHREGDSVFFAPGSSNGIVHILRDSAGLVSEEQVVASLEGCFPVGVVGSGRVEPESTRILGGEEVVPRCMFEVGQVLPVVEAGSASCLLIHVESKRMDKVQHATGSNSRSTDVPRVVGDLRCKKHDVEEWIVHEWADRCVRLDLRLSYSVSPHLGMSLLAGGLEKGIHAELHD